MVRGYRIPAGQMVLMNGYIGGRDKKWIGDDADRQVEVELADARGRIELINSILKERCSRGRDSQR